jgi:addiction module HigA family antidote
LGLSIAKGAKVLGVTRQAMNNLVSCKAWISAEMAICLEKAFGGGAETWLRMQVAYDLVQVEKQIGKIKVWRVKDPLIPA